MTITWQPQSGNGHIVVVRQGSAVNQSPVDWAEPSGGAGDQWDDGTDLGGGTFVAYRGAGSSTTIDGLASLTTYHVAI